MNNGVLPLAMYKESMGYLSATELKSSALTSQALRNIAQWLMFREVWIDLRDSRYRIMARIEFYASERIAPAVRACHLRTFQSAETHVNESSQEIVEAVVSAFRRFDNLRMVWIGRRFDKPDGPTLQIDSKTRMNWPIHVDAIMTSLAVFREIGMSTEYDMQLVDQLPVLSRDATKLHISWDAQTDNVFLNTLAATGPFPYLRSLTIAPYYTTQAFVFEGFLRLCPALEELTVLWDYDWLQTRQGQVPLCPAPDAVPQLKLYAGPDEGIDGFMAGRPVRHLAVPGPRAHVEGGHLLRALGSVKECERVVSLELRVHNLKPDFLKTVCEYFPNLRALAIWAKGYEATSEDGLGCNSETIHSALCTPEEYLQTLEFLTICLENEYEILEVPYCTPRSLSGQCVEPPPNSMPGPDGIFWDRDSPLFPTLDWKQVETLEKYRSLRYLCVQSMNDPELFSFEANRGGASSIEAWRETFELSV
ncbi:hypothetical protein C8R44DRAFT_731881 [Mycena epipterygia]|nr:hypothetical protein C8R44DRAFT_731881 [Mycena epipterygia]